MLDAINIAITRIREAIHSTLQRQDGQTLVEYALIIALVGVGLIVALVFLRDEIRQLFSEVGNTLENAPN